MAPAWVWIAASVVGVLVLLGFVAVMALFFNLWLMVYLSGAEIGMARLVSMRLRKIDVKMVVLARIRAVKAGLNVPLALMEAHAVAGGRVAAVVNAMIAAERAGIGLSWSSASALDLAGRDVERVMLDAANEPLSAWEYEIDSVAGDGVRVTGRARATLRVEPDRLVGGRPRDAVVEAIGEAIASVIGASASGALVSDPERLIEGVLDRRPSEKSAYVLVSLDVEGLGVAP